MRVLASNSKHPGMGNTVLATLVPVASMVPMKFGLNETVSIYAL